MKLATYQAEGVAGFGIVTDGGIIHAAPRMKLSSIREALAQDRLSELEQLATRSPDRGIEDVSFLPVIPDPAHCYCVGVNYADHLREVQDAGIPRPKPKRPSLFIRFPETFVGHGEALTIPKVSEQFDYEAELVVIIGKGGRYIAREHAMAHVAGYSCFNDGSVRDWQFHSSQVTSGKNFPGTGAFGPWMVTADEIGDPGALSIEMRVNDEVLQSSNTSELLFDIAEIVSYASSLVPLMPGDVIATGTPAGVGFSRNPPIFLKPGDVCEVRIGGVGTLRNGIVKEEDVDAYAL